MPLTEEQKAKIALKTEERKKRAAHEGTFVTSVARFIMSTFFAPLFGFLFGRFYMDFSGRTLSRYLEHRYGKFASNCPRPAACEICNRLEGVEGALKKMRAEERVCAYWITLQHSVPDAKTASYIRINKPVLLHGTPGLGNAIEDLVDSLGSDEEVRDFFNPDGGEIDCVVKLGFHGKHAPVDLQVVNIEPTIIPGLPPDAPLLNNAVYPEGLPPDPVQVQAILDAIEEQSKAQIKLPVDASAELQVPKAGPRRNALAHENCPNVFGVPPSASPICVLCAAENDCRAEAELRKHRG